VKPPAFAPLIHRAGFSLTVTSGSPLSGSDAVKVIVTLVPATAFAGVTDKLENTGGMPIPVFVALLCAGEIGLPKRSCTPVTVSVNPEPPRISPAAHVSA
jgi:hypothetical protein